MIEQIGKYNTLTKNLVQEYGREPTIEEIAKSMEITNEEARKIGNFAKHPFSLDNPVGEGEDSEFGDYLIDEKSPSPVDQAMDNLLKERIDTVLKTLNYREREILKLRYGLGNDRGYEYTLEEVGKVFKVTRERIRQIEAKAIRKLQHPIRAKKLEEFVGDNILNEFRDKKNNKGKKS